MRANPQTLRYPHQVGQRVGAHFAHDVSAMKLDRGLSYIQFGRNLLIAVWALGLSSSAAMMMATKGAIPPSLLAISGVIPLKQTLFLWQSVVMALALVVVSVVIAYASAPSAAKAKTAEDYGIKYESMERSLEPRSKPGEWLEYSPLLSILVSALMIWYLVDFFRSSPQGALAPTGALPN